MTGSIEGLDLRSTTTGRVSNPPLPSHSFVTLQYYGVEPLGSVGTSRHFRESGNPKPYPAISASSAVNPNSLLPTQYSLLSSSPLRSTQNENHEHRSIHHPSTIGQAVSRQPGPQRARAPGRRQGHDRCRHRGVRRLRRRGSPAHRGVRSRSSTPTRSTTSAPTSTQPS